MGGVGLADRGRPLPVIRMLFVFLIVGSFALAFSELVRQSDKGEARQLPTASRCGDAIGTPCPTERLM
jgi:hypothetical protein